MEAQDALWYNCLWRLQLYQFPVDSGNFQSKSIHVAVDLFYKSSAGPSFNSQIVFSYYFEVKY